MQQDSWDERLIQIESKLAYQEDALLKVQELAAQNQKQLYHMDKLLEQILERFREIQRAEVKSPGNEKPPHY